MKQVACWLVSSGLECREITGGGGFSIFRGGGGVLFSESYNQIIEVDPIRGGHGLILLSDGRDGRQLVLLLTLSIEPSLWVQGRR